MPTLIRTNVSKPIGKVNKWLYGDSGQLFEEIFVPEKWEVEHSARKLLSYWEDHVYDVFHNRRSSGHNTTGQLGRSLRVKVGVNENESSYGDINAPSTFAFEAGGNITWSMVNIYHTSTRKSTFDRTIDEPIESKGGIRLKMQHPRLARSAAHAASGKQVETWEYGRMLRKGTRASFGAYNKYHDRRMNYGMHPGVSSDMWPRWMEMFESKVMSIMTEELQHAFNRRLND